MSGYNGQILTDDDWTKPIKTRCFKTFKVYWANRQRNANLLNVYDFEQTFTGQFLKAGFITNQPVLPTTNWFGVSVYAPDLKMYKNNKIVHLSLQGISMPLPPPDNKGAWELIHKVSCKYIGLFINKESIYENWTGILPPKELVKEFLNK